MNYSPDYEQGYQDAANGKSIPLRKVSATYLAGWQQGRAANAGDWMSTMRPLADSNLISEGYCR